MMEPQRAEPRYRAFLSYSHKDAPIAARIHRRLESYRVPKRLVGRVTGRGPVPARLSPIFRDREEMAASTDLSETVRAALEQSDALIVLCSPAAAESLWVAEEIATFRALHPDRPVLAAIVAGDPPACFPASLSTRGPDGAWHEPLATDLRRTHDGPHLGLLKLIAGLTGLGLDDLVQRDAQRKLRRVTAVTALALVAMLIMAGLTLFALDARREAERQRAEAEGLVEFMLTDLRDTLKGVGRLDAMSAVNARALRYYGERTNLRGLSDESLARRARVLHAIGDDNLQRHELDAALAAFQEAQDTTAELLERSADDPQRIADDARSHFGIGRVYELQHDWAAAHRHYSAHATAADRLAALAPDDPDFMMRVASSSINLGNVQLNGTKDYAAAQRSYERAVLWLGRAERARPGDLHILLSQANAYGWLADSFFLRSLWRDSLEARLRQFAIVQRLHNSDPNNAEIAFRLAAARRGVAHSLLRTGERARARDHLFQAYASSVHLTERDPANAEWRTLRALLSHDILDAEVGLPPGTTTARLQQDRIRRDGH